MLTKREIKKWLLQNCVDKRGDLNLNGLDFSNFDGNVKISRMKVKKDLLQEFQNVQGYLKQGYQTVGEDLEQDQQQVVGNLEQSAQRVGGHLCQSHQIVKGFIETHKPKENDKVEEKPQSLLINHNCKL